MPDKKETIAELSAQLKALAEKISQTKEFVSNEEQTKMSFIVPFFSILGYNFSDPRVVRPEFTADVCTKKGEKVDYAIMKDERPFILIEAKSYGENLASHAEQLVRYSSALKHQDSKNAQFGILTNGAVYEFFTDAMAENIFDQKPFLSFDLERDEAKTIAEKVYKFTAAYLLQIDPSVLKNDAKQQIYINLIDQIYCREIKAPSEELVKFFINEIGKLDANLKINRITASVLESFKKYVETVLEQHEENLINNKIGEVSRSLEERKLERERELLEQTSEAKIITTEEEIEGFYIARSIFAEVADFDVSRIVYTDTVEYFAINIDAPGGRKTNKWLMRLYFNGRKKFITLNSSACGEKLYIDAPCGMYGYKAQIKQALSEYLATAPKVAKTAPAGVAGVAGATAEFYFQNAKMRYENGKFIVLAGSEIASEETPTCPQGVAAVRASAARAADGKILSDVEFASPSAAASFVCGHSAQGTVLWKTADGTTFADWQERS